MLLSLAVYALPASAEPAGKVPPVYGVQVILSGKSLHHSYVKAGSRVRHSEPLTQPDDIVALGGHLFAGFQNGVGPQGEPSTDGEP